MLKRIQASLGGVGTIRESSKNDCIYKVRSIEDLKKVIAYLDLFPLITKKRSDYLLFKQAVELIDRKEHRTLEGLQKAVNIKASINKGLPEELKREFPETKPVPRPEVKFKCIPDPN